MRYNIIGKNIDVWDKTKEMVEKKMDRVAKLFPADTEATITLSLEKLVSTVEITVPMNKRVVRAEVQDPDMTAAMDKAVDILEGQVVRYKKRMRTKVKAGVDAYAAEYAAILVPEEELDDEPMVKIEKVKHFEVKPMDAEEAVMEMELVGHSFFVFRNGETDEVNVGQLELATFVNEAGLEALGDNLFVQTEASGDPIVDNPDSEGFGSILQGYLNTSNVNPVSEITELISAQRAYEMNSKIISTSDQMLNTINQLK